MTAVDIITKADILRPNTLTISQKRNWVLALEMQIREFVLMYEESNPDAAFLKEENPTLTLSDEHEDIYTFYLLSMISMAAFDIPMYNNYTALFNQMYLNWQKKHRRENIPAKNTRSEVAV